MLWLITLLVAAYVIIYRVYPAYCRRTATHVEAEAALAGDDLIPEPYGQYTLAISIHAPPYAVWPWLAQMGQGRAGFYTHEWVERLVRADIHNLDVIVPDLQKLERGDVIRLTPDPYFGMPGQRCVVQEVREPEELVLLHETHGLRDSWSLTLRPEPGGTRLLMRRRTAKRAVFDLIFLPGYYFMDMGMLAGIRSRAEQPARRLTALGTPA